MLVKMIEKEKMKLSKYNLKNISGKRVILPPEGVFDLPEKVLQFGTGMLLRGLPDYFIDKANRMGVFNGRIVVVKSTSRGDASDFEKQDGLYTICERGISKGKNVEIDIISSAISRVLIAHDEWGNVLNCAHNPELGIIISNTTEMGIQLVKDDDITRLPPVSFPGKLLAFLYERFKAFGGTPESGLVIIPTELLPDNGKVLESIVMELAMLNGLEDEFIEWLENANHFCSSLVDRIVTGMPSPEERDVIFRQLGYKDDLLTVSEVYGLWAIEGNEKIKERLSFSMVNPEVKIEPDINVFRELKLRLLNATHTLSSGIAFLAGIDTVKDAMSHEDMAVFIESLMTNEIAPAIPMKISDEIKRQFIHDVLDRFRNPHIDHHWKTIAQNYSQKLKLRCLPLLVNHFKSCENTLPLITLGFAAWIEYMKVARYESGKYYGKLDGEYYLIDDALARKFFSGTKPKSNEELVSEILGDNSHWNYDLTAFSGFCEGVLKDLELISKKGMKEVLKEAIKCQVLL